MLHDSLCDLLATGPSNHEKHLNKFFKICGMGCWRLDLVTCSRLILVAKNACFAQIGLYSRQFSKLFSFPCITCLFIVLSASPSSKITIFSHKTSIFFINPSSIFKKRYGFSLILKVFYVSSPRFLGFCVFVEIWKYDVRIWLSMFCWVLFMGFVGFVSIMLIIHVLHVCFSFLCIIPYLCRVVYIMSMIKCLIDVFLCLFGFHGIQWV